MIKFSMRFVRLTDKCFSFSKCKRFILQKHISHYSQHDMKMIIYLEYVMVKGNVLS